MSVGKTLVKCSDCGKKYLISHGHYTRRIARKIDICKKCSEKKNAEGLKYKARERAKGMSVSPILIFNIFNSGSAKKTATINSSPYIDGVSEWEFYKKISHNYIKTDKTLAIFNLLKLDPKKVSTRQLKKACIAYLLGLPKKHRFMVINYIFTHVNRVNKATIGQNYYVSDSSGIFEKLFDSLDFKFEKKSKRRIVLKDASFYIKGEWLHIEHQEYDKRNLREFR